VRKRIVTTIETHQIVAVRRPAGATLLPCPACLRDVEVVSLEEAAILAGVSLRDICRSVGADRLHFVETPDGGFVCTDSLLNKASLNGGGLAADGADALLLPAADPSEAADQ
jgi:hypothetical protein